jgi:2-phospho-L-lactate/phosphoenolpyruvate guanylyltransferase
MTTTCAIVPVKSLTEAKRRLASALAPAARRQLVLTMLEDVLTAARAVGQIDALLVVTPDPQVAELARGQGAETLMEERADGLNAAVRRGLTEAQRQGHDRALVLPADVPLATPNELRHVLAAGCSESGAAVIVPAGDQDGTNALLLAPPQAIEPQFGPGSFIAHLSQAVARRLDVRVLHLPGLGADIDRPGDLGHLREGKRTDPRYAFLEPCMAPTQSRQSHDR